MNHTIDAALTTRRCVSPQSWQLRMKKGYIQLLLASQTPTWTWVTLFVQRLSIKVVAHLCNYESKEETPPNLTKRPTPPKQKGQKWIDWCPFRTRLKEGKKKTKSHGKAQAIEKKRQKKYALQRRKNRGCGLLSNHNTPAKEVKGGGDKIAPLG